MFAVLISKYMENGSIYRQVIRGKRVPLINTVMCKEVAVRQDY